MPRIDPFQLLKCLSVLLGPTGGIKSKEEVHRLANLMTKFSKKLVSKCIYIQILKTTDTDLLSQFMDAGGWSLIHMWLTDGIVAKNWALIQELLELLLLCPVKIERLKSNNCPKLIKGLSKEVSHQIVRILAGHLVEQWLKIVKGEAAPNSVPAQIIGGLPSDITLNSMGQLEHNYTEANPPNSGDPENASLAINAAPNSDQATSVATIATDAKVAQSSQNPEETTSQSAATRQTAFVATSTASSAPPAVPVCKITIRDGDQVLAKVETEASNINNAFRGNATHETNGTIGSRDDEDESGASSEEHKDDGAVGRLISSEVKQQTAKEAKEATTTTTTTTAKSKDEGNLKDAVDGASKSSDKENRDSHKTEEGKTGGSCSNNSSLSGEKKSSGSHHGSSSSRSGNSSSKHSSSSHRSGSSSHKSSSSSSSHRSSSSSSRSSKEKSSRDKDRHSSSSSKHGSSSSSSSSSRHKTERDKEREKEKEKLKKDQAEKDKATLEKVQAQAISSKLGKIPRKKPEDEKNAADSLLRKSSTDSRDSSKENKEKTEGKKATAAPAPAAILEKKQISISIENRKNSQDSARPKTVKTFNSKFRSTGLEEEVKPPLPRSASVKKPSVALPASLEKKTIAKPPIASLKRSSPLRETTAAPSDKRAKLSLEPPVISPTDEKKGAIKLIPPKPKPMVLQESDMFMDALTASTKGKEPRKRKRRTSISKDSSSDAKKSEKSDTEGGHDSPQHPSSPQSADDRSPLTVKPNFKFYQDTLETDEDKEDKSDEPSRAKREDDSCDRVKAEGEDNEDDETSITNVVKNEIAATMAKNEAKQAEDEAESAKAEAESPEAEDTTGDAGDFAKNGRSVSPLPEIRYVDGLRSVLLLQKRKGPKKSLKWKTELESVRYFELDETERVNVTKTFTDMKQMEKQNEREAFQMARKLSTEDLMEEKTRWKPLIPIDLLPALVEPGKDSREKDIQYAREKGILQALYFNRSMIPDSASEPDEERHHAMTDPKIIPLEDLTGNKESEKDFTGVAWPEPKPHLTPPQPPVMQPPGGYHFPGAFGHTPPPMMPPMGPQGPMGAMGPPMGPPGPMGPMGPVNPMNAMGPEMGVPMSGPPGGGGGNVGGGGGGGWRTGDGKVVVPDVAMNPMQQQQQQSMPPNMPGGFPPPGMEGPMVPPGMMGPPPMFNQQEGGFGMMGPEDMGFGGYQGPPGPGMFGPGPNFPGGPPPPRGGGPMHGGNRGRGNGPGWFRGGGGGPMRGGGGGGGGGGWRGGWRGNGKQPPICRQFTKNGFCRVGDKCQYLHPGLNCPPF